MILPVNEDAAREPLLRSSSTSDSLDKNAQDDQPSRWQTLRTKLEDIWLQGKGMILVIVSQFFGASMNVIAKLLGQNGDGMDPFQILFARMSITVLASFIYMWYAQVPNPLGTRPVVGLLILRAVGGFFGVYGLYYSVQYLPISEASVLTFLAPILSCYTCSLFIPGERFTGKQQLAAVISLVGVVLIAQPFAFFRSGESANTTTEESDTTKKEYQHTMAVIVSLIGVMGASCAYSTIRMIGTRAHPLVSVTYFSAVTAIISLVAMAALPWVPFKLPATWIDWVLLAGLGVCGFLLQFWLTAGLAYVPPPPKGGTGSSNKSSGSRATSMLYTVMIYAMFYDKVVWGVTLSPVSWVGSALIIGSAISVAMARDDRSGSDGGSAEDAGEREPRENEAAKATSDLEHSHRVEEGGRS
ncbi:hypothetical protein MW887_001768 [Aspergillus wentii]|nr:hypothetical protein MW887_001768 [Aspergillus wentii]